MDLYADNILDHYKHPRHKGVGSEQWGVSHEEKNPSCGDKLTIQLKIDDDRITDLIWSGEGCAISQAGMSMLSETLIGKTTEDATSLLEEDIRTMLGVPISTRRLKCALLCLHTLKNSLHTYHQEPLQTWQETVGNEH